MRIYTFISNEFHKLGMYSDGVAPSPVTWGRDLNNVTGPALLCVRKKRQQSQCNRQSYFARIWDGAQGAKKD
jgi:hypothetical protein